MRNLVRPALAATGRWVQTHRPGAGAPARRPGGRAAARDQQRAGRDGRGGPRRGQPGPGTVRGVRRAHRGRPQLAHPAHGHHHDVGGRAGRRLGPAGRGPGPAARGRRPAGASRRRHAGRRGPRPPRPVHPVRLVLRDDRLPHRDLGQHRVRSDRRPDRRAGAGGLPLSQSGQRAHPSRPDQPGLAARRAGCAGDPGAAGPHPPGRAELTLRPGHPDRRGRCGGRGQRRPGGRPGRHPAGHPAPASARLPALLVQPGHRRPGGRGHRPRPGGRRRRGRAEPRRRPAESGPGHHRPGGRQPGLRVVPRHPRGRLGRPDRAQRVSGRPDPVGGDLVRRSGCW